MTSEYWKELLDKQKQAIFDFQKYLTTLPVAEYEVQGQALQRAIAVYRDINEEYQEALALESQTPPLTSTEAMSAAAYLAHYEHLVTDGNGDLESWYDLPKWEQEGWGKVASAVIAHYEPSDSPIISVGLSRFAEIANQNPETRNRNLDLIQSVAIACFLSHYQYQILSQSWNDKQWYGLPSDEKMKWISAAEAAIATFELGGDWEKALSKLTQAKQ
jgi:hypothetical protein